MRRLVPAFTIAFSLLLGGVSYAYVSPGGPSGYANDFAHVLSENTKIVLESELSEFEKSTSNEIAVAIVPSLGGDYIENYAVKLFEDWGVGKNDKDNGVLLLLAINDREMRIEVGYGLEGALPDSLAQRILDDELTPRLRSGDYDGAVTAGVQAIEKATRGEYVSTQSSTDMSWLADNFMPIFIGIIMVFQWIAAILARSKSWWAGGVLGVLAGLGIGWFASLSGQFAGLLAAMIGFFGLVLDYIVSSAYHSHIARGTTPPWWAGGSGGGFRGSGGGGGFGGFGGGSSGGGGASGRW